MNRECSEISSVMTRSIKIGLMLDCDESRSNIYQKPKSFNIKDEHTSINFYLYLLHKGESCGGSEESGDSESGSDEHNYAIDIVWNKEPSLSVALTEKLNNLNITKYDFEEVPMAPEIEEKWTREHYVKRK